jgi:ribosomal protein L40E
MANHLTEAQMNNYFGWKQGSNMPSVYVHLSGRDMDNAILKMNGIKSKNTEKKQSFAPRQCQRCDIMNPPAGKFCFKCGMPLDQETVMKVEEKRNEMDNIMTILLKDLLKDPEIYARIENKLQQIKVEAKT